MTTRVHARYTASTSPPPPQHVSTALRVGDKVLLRKPGTWCDLKGELRALDQDLALIFVKGQLERVPREWLRSAREP